MVFRVGFGPTHLLYYRFSSKVPRLFAGLWVSPTDWTSSTSFCHLRGGRYARPELTGRSRHSLSVHFNRFGLFALPFLRVRSAAVGEALVLWLYLAFLHDLVIL
ncbi:hypothetical protein A7K93_09740 [Candidatus Methylacidiphilum fumarolicum]|nr:hypothetical protein [Candidatus Methylacidiphilum fumarolicum]TFE66915.1 hypothetical protein A7K73_09650 [Candidatus Methylacidiphilum fumarolicum]TFE71477.1 hypothetical protein A7K72_10810 [Candidatus Methylacidiphilum fumarolicum]TFE71998.1 hypothetical protein A7K93_09740 [Candidatus Methylacidiphilum fumarolicum]TFE75067.1 hypothetical protein A7D33_11090 [Candidatus Methylacidiphilum fumarolicum]